MQTLKAMDVEELTGKSVYTQLQELIAERIAECEPLNELEKKERLKPFVSAYNRGLGNLTLVAFIALAILGNTKGAEFFRENIPFSVREEYYKTADTLKHGDDPTTIEFLRTLFIGDKPETDNQNTQEAR